MTVSDRWQKMMNRKGLVQSRRKACRPYRYLYKSNSPGVQDYLCNRLYALPEAGLEKYLSQLIQLIIIKPYGPLEKVVVDLCAKSLRIAVKVSSNLHSIRLAPDLAVTFIGTDPYALQQPPCAQGWSEEMPSTVPAMSQDGCGPCRRTGCCSRCLRTSPRTSMWQSCGTAASALHWKAPGCAPP